MLTGVLKLAFLGNYSNPRFLRQNRLLKFLATNLREILGKVG